MLLAVVAFFASPPALADLVARASWKSPDFKVSSELHYDRSKKAFGVWVEYEQGKTEKDRISFKATSLQARYSEADTRLRAQPVAKVDGQTSLIFDAFDMDSGKYNPNRGVAVLFHFPIANLPARSVEELRAAFPSAFAPKYVKALLCRITEYRIYPVAAFDYEAAP
jgi:hypothetical protein